MQSYSDSGNRVCSTGASNVWRRVLVNLLLISAGSIVYAAGINGVIVSQGFLSGGVMGITLIGHYLFPWINIGLGYLVLNIPLMLLGWFCVSRRFMLYTVFGMVMFSTATGLVFPKFPHIDNPILAAVLGGIICGTGVGITLRSQGSGGGTEILLVYLRKKLGLRMGAMSFLFNALVLAVAGYFFSLERALYSLIFMYVSGMVIDSILTGFNQRKAIVIITDCADAVAAQILNRLHRGATLLEGTGAYTGSSKKVIFSIITLTELSKMKELVFDIDPHAFMVVNDTLEVIGKRHGSLEDI
jgi:uncharacterized membrane-anchored protein YitT (DUF2179 family)